MSSSEALSPLPRVCITLEAVKKLHYFVRLIATEINGLGLVERRGNDFLVTDVFILKQRVSSVGAEIDPVALNEVVASCEDPSQLRMQWHSHVDMQAYFSSTDLSTIRGYSNDFMISLVLNKAGECSCRLDVFKPIPVSFRVPLIAVLPPDENLRQQCLDEIREKVRDSRITVRGTLLRQETRLSQWNEEREPMLVPFARIEAGDVKDDPS